MSPSPSLYSVDHGPLLPSFYLFDRSEALGPVAELFSNDKKRPWTAALGKVAEFGIRRDRLSL